jgi:hypothetical protein
VSLFDEPPFQGVTPVLANAFRVENVPYRWERGRLIRPMTAASTAVSGEGAGSSGEREAGGGFAG